MPKSFLQLRNEVSQCQLCADSLLLPPKPILKIHKNARLLIIAQAPGAKARASGLPFDDASGDRLRQWLGISRELFYQSTRIACMPMGFCFPGTRAGGDLPPCSICAPIWHHQIIQHLTSLKLILLVGIYAHRFYLNEHTVSTAVKNWNKFAPYLLPLPHPSWHNNAWLSQHPWFETTLLPDLRYRVSQLMHG